MYLEEMLAREDYLDPNHVCNPASTLLSTAEEFVPGIRVNQALDSALKLCVRHENRCHREMLIVVALRSTRI